MKRVYTLLLMALLFMVGTVKVQAQVVDVCAGNDSVVLRLGNFQYGYVQWQVSDDNIEWQDIEGAIDTVYKFLPERPRYYRAEVRFPACTENDYYSQVTYVQMPPVAKAGPDVDVPVNVPVRMMAMPFAGAEGEWSIIEGSGGSFDDVSNPNAMFTGGEGDYKLVWTLTNSCGASSDTVAVRCITMEFNNNLFIVDETDVILSDTLQLLNGEYVILFTDTVPSITEGTVLIGYREQSFFRKVTSFEKIGDVFVMQTEQATLSDVIFSGAMCVDLNDFGDISKEVRVLERFPTRKELLADPTLLNDGSIYFIKGNCLKEDPEDPPVLFGFKFENGVFKLSAEFDFKLLDPDLDGLKLKLEGDAVLNFRINPSFYDQDVVRFAIGFYNAEVTHTIKLYTEKELNGITLKHKGNLNPHQLIVGVFAISGVPITVTLDFPYSAEISATIGGLELERTVTYTITHSLEWRKGEGLVEVAEKSEPVTEVKPFNITGNLDAEVEVGLKLGLLIADAVGPTASLKGKIGPSLCYSITRPHTITAELGWSLDSKIGGRLQLFSNKVGIDFEGKKTLYKDSEKAPSRLVRVGGDQQVYNPMDWDFIQSGGYLPNDIQVKVKGWFGANMPFAFVYFEPENGGEVSSDMVIADIHGNASVRWKPGLTEGHDRLKARVYNCDGEPMAGSPLIFHAYTQGTGGCWNSGLTAEFKEEMSYDGMKTIVFLVNGGSEPYEYSTDGTNYNPLLQTICIHPEPRHTYHYYVRDANGCEAETYYNEPGVDCEISTLSLNTRVYNGNSIMAWAEGGTVGALSGYMYSIDGTNYFTPQPSSSPFVQSPFFFNDLIDGDYTVYVKDMAGCVCTQDVTINHNANIGVVIEDEGYDIFGNPVGTVRMLSSVPVIHDRGVCWIEKNSANELPTVSDFTHSYGSGSDDYSFTLQGLEHKTYYVRAYVFTDAGTAYSNTVELTPHFIVTTPFVYATAVSSITSNSANCSSNVINDGYAEVTDRGFCWSATNVSPTLVDNHVCCGTGTGVFAEELIGLESLTTYYVCAYATNSQGTSYGLVNQFTTKANGGGGGGGNNYDYVDLGLPSGTLWATCNVGANAPEEYGDYFAWAEVVTKTSYNWDSYAYCNGTGNQLTKYCNQSDYGYNGFTDALTLLLPSDDAAAINCGVDWCMPTDAQWEELIQNTTNAWVTLNGVGGRLFTAANGESIFLPASGCYYGANLVGVGGYGGYWSSSLFIDNPSRAWCLNFHSGNGNMSDYDRSSGQSVRPVRSNPGGTGEAPQGAINGKFTINADGNQVYFSQGNLQYISSSNTWRFADNQWDHFGNDSDHFNFGVGNNLSNNIVNGGMGVINWRKLTVDEWNYIFNTRETISGIRWAKGVVNGTNGVILLPDDWNTSNYSLNGINGGTYNSNIISSATWISSFESKGAVFLPAAGYYNNEYYEGVGDIGYYWSSTPWIDGISYFVFFTSDGINPTDRYRTFLLLSVRLVCPVED